MYFSKMKAESQSASISFFENRVNEMKNISNRNVICQKSGFIEVHCCDTDVNDVATHVSTYGFIIMVTKAVYLVLILKSTSHMIAQAHR